MNILDLRGPEFLAVYLMGFGGAIVAGLLIRQLLRGPRRAQPAEAATLDPLEIAYLTGGEKLAINTAIAGLYRKKSIGLTAGTRSLVAVQRPAIPAHPIEEDIYRLIASAGSVGMSVRNVHRRISPDVAAKRPTALGLLMPFTARFRAGLMSAIPMMLLLLLGTAKIAVGISRNRPVVFLVILCLITAFAIILFLAKAPRRTRTGDAVLQALRWKNASLQISAVTNPGSLGMAELALAMGLFGPAALADAELRKAIVPPGAGSGSSCGSGCGSSCGGGGGCGGGGCGGCGG